MATNIVNEPWVVDAILQQLGLNESHRQEVQGYVEQRRRAHEDQIRRLRVCL